MLEGFSLDPAALVGVGLILAFFAAVLFYGLRPQDDGSENRAASPRHSEDDSG